MVKREDKLHVARRFQLELVMLGVMLARDGDGQRVRERIGSELIAMNTVKECVSAIEKQDRNAVADWFAALGVQLMKGETVVDAILRTYLDDRRSEIESQLEKIIKACKAEHDLAAKRLTENGE